ncbi:MAG: hypothetical protein BZY81_01860 [SAR202 cluster bacterium Io17-Chloro-G4]|nr:MAG: hypothetical protein BZY81_01860 [SAR202 cluster bacterium Io17-Chloro-G4]
MADNLNIKQVESEEDMEAAIAVRFRVFVDEQSIPPEEELDEADATATHAIAVSDGSVVGTGRLVWADDGSAHIGRMAVDAPWRRKGVGGEILTFLEDFARKQGLTHSVLHAQEYVKSFYAAHGYQQHGDTFLEVDIPHVEMRKEL